MRLEALAVTLPEVVDHPNRVNFEGVLTLIDEPSNRAPSGARGRHRRGRTCRPRAIDETGLTSSMRLGPRPSMGPRRRARLGRVVTALSSDPLAGRALPGRVVVAHGTHGPEIWGQSARCPRPHQAEPRSPG